MTLLDDDDASPVFDFYKLDLLINCLKTRMPFFYPAEGTNLVGKTLIVVCVKSDRD
jgi:hypothetical protein